MKLVKWCLMLGLTVATTVGGIGARGVAHADPGIGDKIPGTPSTGMVLVLVDRSGSMYDPGKNCRNPDGSMVTTPIRKWQCAVRAGNFRVTQGDQAATKRYFIWAFANMADDSTDGQPVWSIDKTGQPVKGTDGKVAPAAVTDALALSRGDAIAALNALDALGPQRDDASTPLAGAYCGAIQKLTAYRDTKIKYPLTLLLESDGMENATPLGVTCQGLDSFYAGKYFTAAVDPTKVDLVAKPAPNASYIDTADGLMVPSWQSYMLDMSATGTAHAADATGVTFASNAFQNPPTSMAFLTNIDYISTFIETSMMSLAPMAALPESPKGDGAVTRAAALRMTTTSAAPATLAATSYTDPGIEFLNGTATLTGGRLMTFGSGEAPAPGDPTAPHAIPADVDNNGCVNAADYTILKQFYNQKVSAAQPQSYAADINSDAQIDVNDYLMMKTAWGTGCSTPPGTFPVLGQSIFGFESLTNWTSNAAAVLSLVGVPRTEGDFSVSVDWAKGYSGGFRTLNSSKFPTSSFQGITSTLALDVYLPANPSNKYWLGQVLIFASCPSANLYNVPLGNAELTGKPLGAFSTVKFSIPLAVKNAMSTAHSDFSFSVSLNANDSGYLLDNLRFVAP
jgi:hypothetical protein